MKLFIVAALIAVSSAGRLEHLERGYLPPDHSASQGSFVRGSFGSQSNFGHNSIGSASKTASFRSGAFGAATSNQYLPPDHGPSSGFNSFGSQGTFSAHQAPSTQYGVPQFGSHGQQSNFGSQFSRSQNLNQGSQFGAHSQPTHGSHFGSSQSSHFGSHDQFSQTPSTQYGAPGQFGAASNGFGSSSAGFGASGSFRSQNQFGAASRQYLAPKTSSNFQNIPQQSFDEETGYHY